MSFIIHVNVRGMSAFLVDLKRTHDCGARRSGDAGKQVVLFPSRLNPGQFHALAEWPPIFKSSSW